MSEAAEADWGRPILLYASALDDKRFGLLRDVFHPEVRTDYAGRVTQGVEPLIKRMQGLHHHLRGSLHRLTNTRIVKQTSDGYQVETYVDAFLVGGDEVDNRTYRDVGSYRDLIAWHEGRWQINERRYQRLWREGDVMDLQPPQPTRTR